MANNEVNIIIKLQDQISNGLKNISSGFDSLTKKTQSLGAALEKSKFVFAGIAAGFGAVAASAIKTAGEFESYEATLKVMLGTTDAAKARLKELSDFAAKTPFSLPQVVELGNQLQSIGRYSKENMTMLGDLAAAAGKPIDQVSRAFAKLATGQKGEGVNMFRELLISTNDWVEATGKGISKSGELMATTEEMIAALPKIMAKKNFTGMMEEQSKTFQGIMSNLGDAITRVGLIMGQYLLPYAKQFAQFLISLTEKFNNLSPGMQKFIAFAMIAVAGIAALLAGIAAILPLIGALSAAFVVLTGPVGIVIGAVVLLTTLFIKFHTQIFAIGKAIGAVAGWMFAPIINSVKTVMQWIDAVINKFDFLKRAVDKLSGIFGKKKTVDLATNQTTTSTTTATQAPQTAGAKEGPVDFKKGIEDFTKAELQKTNILKQNVDLRKATEQEYLDSIAELKAEKAEQDLQKTQAEIDALDAYYALQQEKYAGNQEMLASLDIAYNEAKLQLEQERIAEIDALRDAEYLRDKQRMTGGLQSFINMLDIKKAMTKSQAQDFEKWQNFMAGATQSANKEVAAISKAMAIYDIGIKTAEAAMAAFNAGVKTGGPFGIPLGIAMAATAVAWGGEQAAKVAGMQPALAEGGMVRSQVGGQSVTVAEGGKDEAVVPLDDPATAQRIQQATGGGANQVVQLVVDGVVLAETVVQGYNKGINIGTVTRLK